VVRQVVREDCFDQVLVDGVEAKEGGLTHGGFVVSICSSRRFGEDNGVKTRDEPGMESVSWGQQDHDSIPHRYKMPWIRSKPEDAMCTFIHNFGTCEIKEFGHKIDDFKNKDPELAGRTCSQADTHNRFAMRAMAGLAGNISPLLPGAGGSFFHGTWNVYHGHAGIEFSGNRDKTSEKITWCRPQFGKRANTSNYLLLEVKRWPVTWSELMELLRYERSWDDPSVIIGKMGVGIRPGNVPQNGLCLSECGRLWVLGEIDLRAKHEWINNLPLELMEKIYHRESRFLSMGEMYL